MNDNPLAVIAIGAALAAVVTQIIDLVRKAIDPKAKFPKWIWGLAGFAAGVQIAFAASLNALGEFGVERITGTIYTGLFIGAGSAAWHRVFSLIDEKRAALKATISK